MLMEVTFPEDSSVATSYMRLRKLMVQLDL